ncbi:SWI/SNF chromatin-remodeling complex subunit [Mortierella alpina]|uniref:SWI/SNF chromatin-remodeling complex subunit n=1 Tax=Mortierella alpina TaxID=64518 RepID=A0A9P6IWE9_MORAP|nr:SWI/SNF chromatin-remodeling complex subunit [Mortierella alpina]
MSEAALTSGPVAPSLGSSLLPHHNSTTTQIGPSPAMTDLQRSELERYMSRDALFLSAFEHQRQMQLALLNEKQLGIRQIAQSGAEIFGPGYHPACGNGATVSGPHGNAFQIVYPAHRRRARKSKAFTFPRLLVEEQAQKEDVLVPIRLEIELDGLVLRDTFTWNLYESLITPEHFAEVLCEDMQFPAQQFAPLIAKHIREQIQDYHLPVLSTTVPPLEDQDPVVQEEGRPSQELRILIKIDITVANTSLVDQFEWDISCSSNDPEHFAEVLAAELGLGGEFRTAIAHSIREQVQTHTKCLNLIGYSYDGSSVNDEDLRGSFLPKLITILREEEAVEQFTPILEKLTEPEIDKLERDRERDKRRKRRQTRGRRGVILPDRWDQQREGPRWLMTTPLRVPHPPFLLPWLARDRHRITGSRGNYEDQDQIFQYTIWGFLGPQYTDPRTLGIKVAENMPGSLVQDRARLHQLYPSDRFEILVRSGTSENAMIEDYRVRCLECPPGKLYNCGPDGTLQNFEVHLKSNRAHRSYVELKKSRGGAAPLHASQQALPSSSLNPQQQNQPYLAQYQQAQRINGVGLGIEG